MHSRQVSDSKQARQKPKAFKDWFDRTAAQRLASQVADVQPGFDQKRFVRLAARNLKGLEFAGRVRQFSDALRATLPDSIPAALHVLTRSLPPEQPDAESVTDGWLQWPVGQFIADHGLNHFDASMSAMVELTKRFSSEFAVRPFVEQRPRETFARLQSLTDHPNQHVRRWCSEGTRPRLPWGKKLRALVSDPSPIWPIVEALKDDDELYVRRSVANNLNDIAKDHPMAVVRRCKAWSRHSTTGRDWIVKHALRSLVKAGDPDALAVVGFAPPKKLSAELWVRPKQIAVGSAVQLTAQLTSTLGRAQDLLVDYAVHYVRQGGKTAAKVFKWTRVRLPARGQLTVEKRHAMRLTTIRALYPGVHRLELQVNGVRMATATFKLI